jgi:hypothetical protein
MAKADKEVEVIEEPKPEKKRRKATLEDLKPAVMVIEVDDVDEDGEPIALEFTLKTLSFFTYNSLGAQVADPSLATIGMDKNGKPLYDTNSWQYRVGLNDAANERMVRRLAAALIEPEIPGNDIPEKAQWIKDTMSPGIVNQLAILMATAANRGEARIANRADNFQ